MRNRSDRRGRKPKPPLCRFRPRRRLASRADFHHGQSVALSNTGRRYGCSLISSSTETSPSLAERSREPSSKGNTETCLFLTEESRYGVVDQGIFVPDLGPPPRRALFGRFAVSVDVRGTPPVQEGRWLADRFL